MMISMKVAITVGSVAAALVSATAASAQRINFTYSGEVVTYKVRHTGTYEILAFGAQGGSGTCSESLACPNTFGEGGRGAEIGGTFVLHKGEILHIWVGGAGADRTSGGGGGGGGTFVVGPGNEPVVIAGGGGGGTAMFTTPSPGGGGLTGQAGGAAGLLRNGGTSGSGGGDGGFGGGGGGGGFFSAGKSSIPPNTGGAAFPNLAGGEFGGGFGGGGGASRGPGGGGGYSGGGGGDGLHDEGDGAGGGGSFNAGTDQILIADSQMGDGEVVIRRISPAFAGIPGKAGCIAQSVAAVIKQHSGLNEGAAALGFDSIKSLQSAVHEFCEA